jgi:hypothetical protein
VPVPPVLPGPELAEPVPEGAGLAGEPLAGSDGTAVAGGWLMAVADGSADGDPAGLASRAAVVRPEARQVPARPVPSLPVFPLLVPAVPVPAAFASFALPVPAMAGDMLAGDMLAPASAARVRPAAGHPAPRARPPAACPSSRLAAAEDACGESPRPSSRRVPFPAGMPALSWPGPSTAVVWPPVSTAELAWTIVWRTGVMASATAASTPTPPSTAAGLVQ